MPSGINNIVSCMFLKENSILVIAMALISGEDELNFIIDNIASTAPQ